MVRLWDATSGAQQRYLRGHESHVTAVCFAPDGDILASGSQDGTVLLWDTEAGKERLSLDCTFRKKSVQVTRLSRRRTKPRIFRVNGRRR